MLVFLQKYKETLLKILIISVFCGFIYYEVFQKQDVESLWKTFLFQFQNSNQFYLWLAIILMPLNWGLEAYKWYYLVLKFEKISFLRAFKAVLLGVSIGLFTPARIGEYGGRALLVESKHIIESVVATFLGSISQFLATLFFGYIGVIYFLFYFKLIASELIYLLLSLGVFSFLLTLFLFYNIDVLVKILKRIYQRPFFQHSLFIRIHYLVNSWLKHVKILRNYTASQLSLALFSAFLRYIVYTLQYYLLLQFMGIEVSFVTGVACIATVFLLQTSIPLPPVTGLLARGSAALYIWQYFTTNQIAILATTFGLWILNVVIPATIGLVILIFYKKRKTKAENAN